MRDLNPMFMTPTEVEGIVWFDIDEHFPIGEAPEDVKIWARVRGNVPGQDFIYEIDAGDFRIETFVPASESQDGFDIEVYGTDITRSTYQWCYACDGQWQLEQQRQPA